MAKNEFQFEMRQAEYEREQTALDLGINANSGWGDIHREEDRLQLADELHLSRETSWKDIHKEVSRLATIKRQELSNTVKWVYAIQMGLPEESTIEEIADKMLANEVRESPKKSAEIQMVN